MKIKMPTTINISLNIIGGYFLSKRIIVQVFYLFLSKPHQNLIRHQNLHQQWYSHWYFYLKRLD